MVREKILLEEDFHAFETGMFSGDVGPHTEYHYLPEAAPKVGWSVACFSSRRAGRAWFVAEVDGRKAMHQTFENSLAYTHPMLAAGDFLWSNYTLTVEFRPEVFGGRCGVIFRYHNNRCYYFFGFEKDRVVLKLVQHEIDFHLPFEKDLAAKECFWSGGRDYVAIVTTDGPCIRAEIEGMAVLEAEDSTYLRGKIGLVSDISAFFFSVKVTAPEPESKQFAMLRSKRERELEDLRVANPRPVLWKKFSTEGFGVARNLRFGDLTGNGQIDLVVGQITAHGPRDTYSEVGCITAMTFDGEILWQSGEPDSEKYSLTNDVALQIHDIDGDGRNEVIYARDFEIVVADGASGEIKYKVPSPESRPPADRYTRILGDCLFFCDLRGTGRPSDLIIKDRYWHFWVFDDRLNPLWERSCRTGHYPFAADIDGDGHDELAMDFALYDHRGGLLWNLEDKIQDHADGIAIVDFQEKPDSCPKILYAASDSGVLFVDLEGGILKHHRIGHAQNPAIGKFRGDLPGLQAVSINFWGNQGILHFYDGNGDIYHDCEPLNMGSMCLPVNWTGGEEEFFVHNTNPFNGGMFDGWGRPVVMFPDDGHPDMCYAVVDLTGDCRDEVVVWDQHEVWVYTQEDNPKKGQLYRPWRSPLYNYSNYQATVSLPGSSTCS